MKADSNLIKWLLEEATVSKYNISKATGIAQATLSDLSTGKTSIEKMNFGTAAALSEYAQNKLLEDTRMNFRILENGEIKSLEITTRDGIDWTADLLGNNGALNFNRETEEYELDTLEDYQWWAEYIKNWMADDQEVIALAEELGISVSEIDERIGKEISINDLTQHHDIIQDILETMREEAPVYIIESEDPDKVRLGDHAIVELHRTKNKDEALNIFKTMYFDKGHTLLISKMAHGGEIEMIAEKRDMW